MWVMLDLRRRAIAVTGVVALAAAAAGCGASTQGTASTTASAAPVRTVPESAIARAADVSDAAKGYAFTMSMVESVPHSGRVTVGGSGTYSSASRSGNFAMTMDGAGQNLQLQEIIVGHTIYMKMPASLAAKLPGSKPWWELDFDQLKGKTYLSDLGSLESSSSQSSPAMYLEYLKAASSSLKDLGQTTIDGVATTHYRASLNLEKVAADRSPATRAAVQDMLKKMPGTLSNLTDIPVDVWIDSAHRVRKLSMAMQIVPKGTSTAISASVMIRINDYGPQPAATPPPADQTLNLVALLKSKGKLSQLGG